jgi:ATPase family AAA domain-containing protein 1
LDEAVLRRLPRRIMVDLPNLSTRKDILQVTLANNRVGFDVDFDKLAASLDGYTGSDIKEVCREAVVHVAHERAHWLEYGSAPPPDLGGNTSTTDNSYEVSADLNAPLRPVHMSDFKYAMTKLKASVSERGRELQKVLQWNEKYGEVKKAKRRDVSHVNLYI